VPSATKPAGTIVPSSTTECRDYSDALALARGDGRHARLLKSLARVELLILDDWGLSPMTADQRRDLLEILEDRHGRGSTIVTSQLPVEHWAGFSPARADAGSHRQQRISQSPFQGSAAARLGQERGPTTTLSIASEIALYPISDYHGAHHPAHVAGPRTPNCNQHRAHRCGGWAWRSHACGEGHSIWPEK
jgi:hypothetical protein